MKKQNTIGKFFMIALIGAIFLAGGVNVTYADDGTHIAGGGRSSGTYMTGGGRTESSSTTTTTNQTCNGGALGSGGRADCNGGALGSGGIASSSSESLTGNVILDSIFSLFF